MIGFTSLGNELSYSAHTAANTAVAQHHSIGFSPVGTAQCDSLGIEEAELESLQIIFQRVVSVREGLYQTTHLIGLQSLFQTGIASSRSVVLVGLQFE